MPKRKRERRERTHDWQQIQQYTLWPEQKAYELLRPIVLFGETVAERAKETDQAERTLHYKADQFDQQGMASLFHKDSTPSPDKSRSLPPDMRQLIVDRKRRTPRLSPQRDRNDLFSALWPQAFASHSAAGTGRRTKTLGHNAALSALCPDC